MSTMLLSTNIVPSIVIAQAESNEDPEEETEIIESNEENQDSEDNETDDSLVEESSLDALSLSEYLRIHSNNSIELFSTIHIELSENQDIILKGQIPSGYNLLLTLGEYPTIVDGEEFELTIASVQENLGISLIDEVTQESIEEVTVDLADLIKELLDLSGDKPLETVEELPDSLNDLEIFEDDGEEISRYFEVEEVLHDENRTLSLVEKDQVAPFSANGEREHQNGIYTVASGDTFNQIAESFELTPLQLRHWNSHISNINILQVGDKIAVDRQGVESMLSSSDRARLVSNDNPAEFNSTHEFISGIAPMAIEVSNQAGEEALYPSLMIAQAMHESGVARQGIGMSQLSRPPYNNLFGIKAGVNQPSALAWTWEQIQGERVDVIAAFRTFPSYVDSLQGYANLLRYGRGTGEDFYYRGTWSSNTNDVFQVLDDGGLRGYATDPAYFNAIRNYINNYDLTRFDRNVERIQGQNRFQTAAHVSREGWNSSDTVVITDGFEFADALAGAPLAAELNAPILLTRSNRLEAATKDEILRLGAKNAIILGGEVAVSSDVEAELNSLGVSTNRIAGATRYETAGLIADELISRTGATEGILVYGFDFADAMSVASFAAREGIPIYLTPTRQLSTEVLHASNQLDDWYIIGGPIAITGAVGQRLQGRVSGDVTRISGDNRYATNQRVINHFGNGGEQVYVASGTDFPDALTGSVLAGREGSGVMLVNNSDRYIRSQINFSKNNGLTNFTLLGGEVALPKRIEQSFEMFRVVE